MLLHRALWRTGKLSVIMTLLSYDLSFGKLWLIGLTGIGIIHREEGSKENYPNFLFFNHFLLAIAMRMEDSQNICGTRVLVFFMAAVHSFDIASFILVES